MDASEDNSALHQHPEKELTASPESSLSLSITPPLLKENKVTTKEVNSDASISEHLSSNSFENDRSFREIEIAHEPQVAALYLSDDDLHLSQELKPDVLNSSYNSDESITAQNYCEKIDIDWEGNKNVKSILEEILNNEQFKSDTDTNSKETSLNIFAHVDLDDKSLNNYKLNNDVSLNEKNLFASNFGLHMGSDDGEVYKKIKDFEELIAIKDSTIAALTSEVDSFKEMSIPNTLSMVSVTEYKQLQEEFHNKLTECNSAILVKNELIQQLSESLDQSVKERKELLTQIDQFKNEIAQLEVQLRDTSKIFQEHKCNAPSCGTEKLNKAHPIIEPNTKTELDVETIINLDQEFPSKPIELDSEVNSLNINEFEKRLKEIQTLHDMEKQELIKKMEDEKNEYDTEIARLRDLLANIKCGSTEIMELKTELELKHAKEVEELRTYFEKKCSELEKNFSEEVFSQQSRKLSESSCSEDELNSEGLFSHPGPGGDASDMNKVEVQSLREGFSALVERLKDKNIDEMGDGELLEIKEEFGKDLWKTEEAIRSEEVDGKYVEEKEDVDRIKAEYEEKLRYLDEMRRAEVEELRKQIRDSGGINSVQEVASSGEFEIVEVVESYERRLQEQVSLAKIDIMLALESQFQRLAANEIDDEEEWPTELLRLRDKFTNKYEAEISALKQSYEIEINRLKDEHSRILNSALERARRRSLRDSDSLSKGEVELLKERDNLKKQSLTLRNLLSELLKYFTQCEDELNNTLVEELLKQGFDKNFSQLEEEFNLNDSSATSSSQTDSSHVKRVHLTPNFNELISLIENTTSDTDDKDISIDLKNELGLCLEKLKQEANAILALTTNLPKTPGTPSTSGNLDEKISSLTRQLLGEAQQKDKLKAELEEAFSLVHSLEKEKENLEGQLDEVIAKVHVLEADLGKAREKISELIENGHKEIVSEGYGELAVQGSGDTSAWLADLQEKARNILHSRTSADPNLLNLIEELCRICETIQDEAKRDRLDLLRQENVTLSPQKCTSTKIEVADKKYKTTCGFLEEQANEREIERDEAQKRIDSLNEQLKEREKDRASRERITNEENGVCCRQCRFKNRSGSVELLEQQLNEMTKLLAEEARKFKEVESERNEAVEKIKVLREIIRDLEAQTESKNKEAEDHLAAIEKLQCILSQQNRSIDEFNSQDSLGEFSDIQELRKHVESLQSEVLQLRVSSELAGSEGALRQIKLQLHELEVSLDKKTKDLEVSQSSFNTNSCSSPSEDVSVRDMLRSQAPNSSTMDECELPLQQLARLKEKLVRHSRAEDAAIKRIRDLEMQIFNLKTEIEEMQNEKEILKNQNQEQLVLISDLQIRLDEQRIRADHIEKQANTSLELKIYSLQSEISTLIDTIHNREKTIKQLNGIIEETKKKLNEQEEELSSNANDETIISMQKEIERLRSENSQMRKKINNEAQMLPNLVGSIISDKNTDLEKLREKLETTEKLLDKYTSLRLDLSDLQTISNLKYSGTSLTELVSILELSEPDRLRRVYNNSSNNFSSSQKLDFKKDQTDTKIIDISEPEISNIESNSHQNSNFTLNAPLLKPNSTEIHKSIDKRVHFEDDEIGKLQEEIEKLKNELESKDMLIKKLEEQLNCLADFEAKIEELQKNLEQTERALSTATENFQKEQNEVLEKDKELRLELAEKKVQLAEIEKEVQMLREDSNRKDQMCLELTKEKKSLEKELLSFTNESYKSLDKVINEKNQQIEDLTLKLEELESIKAELRKKSLDIDKLKNIQEDLEDKLEKETEKNIKLTKEITNNASKIETYTVEFNKLRDKMMIKKKKIKNLEDSLEKLEGDIVKLKDIIADKECEIEILNEDAKRYQNDIAQLENTVKQAENSALQKKLNLLEKTLADRDDELVKLGKEIEHLKDLLAEKEKIIVQMTEDSEKLHVNLVTIESKIKETGNIIDLGNRLKEEMKKNSKLLDTIHELKAQLMHYDGVKKMDMTTSVEEITGQVRRELNFAAEIDSNILSAVSDHSISSISDTQDIEFYKRALSKERSKNKILADAKDRLQSELQAAEDRCEMFKSKTLNLHELLERERFLLQQTQLEDAKLLEKVRTRLDEALNNEEEFSKLIENEKAVRRQLEIEIEALRSKNNGSGHSKSESTDYKKPPSEEAFELERIKQELQNVKDQNDRMQSEIKLLKQIRNELERNIKFNNDMMKIEVDRVKNLEIKVATFLDNERELKDVISRLRYQLEQKENDFEQQKLLMDQLEEDKANLFKQKSDLLERVHAIQINQNEGEMRTALPDILLEKIRELNNSLIDNKKLLDCIARMDSEKARLLKQVEDLEEMINEKAPEALPFKDLVARSDYLFAKTLRLESFRKSLVWQKRYLMNYLRFHQSFCNVEILPESKTLRLRKRTLGTRQMSPIDRFRSVAFAIVSIFRMKFIVRRWRSNSRLAETVNSRHQRFKSNRYQPSAMLPDNMVNFQVGQPVSSQQFVLAGTSRDAIDQRQTLRTPDREPNISWTGSTPPQKEKNQNRLHIGSQVLSREDLSPLKAPQLLAQFTERIDQVQETLRVVLSNK